MHKQKFKDPLSSTCQISSERSVGLGIRDLGSILIRGNILSLDFFLFSRSKASNANIGIIVKTPNEFVRAT